MELIPNKPIKCKINNVSDGDTILVYYQGFQFSTRARWIDCPETQKHNQSSTDSRILKHWYYAQKAKEYLTQLLIGKELFIIPIEKDYYGRWLSDWYLNKVSSCNCTNIQIKLCQKGLATHFLPFQRYDFNNREQVLYLEIIKSCLKASKRKLGFWQEPDFIISYEFKKLNI